MSDVSGFSINAGDQFLSFDYRQEARAKIFNRLLKDIVPPGIYSGGTLNRISDVQVSVAPSVNFIHDASGDAQLNLGVRIETQSAQTISFDDGTGYCDTTKPYIVFRFVWADDEVNYMGMVRVSFSNNPNETDETKILPDDLIVGKVLFEEETPGSGNYIIRTSSPFDYTRKTVGYLPSLDDRQTELNVKPSEFDPKKLSVTSGTLLTSIGRQSVTGGDYPTGGITDTTAFGRNDILYIDENGDLQYEEGTPSASPVTPDYENKYVLVEVRRGPNRNNVLGTDLIRVANERRSVISAQRFPIADADNYFLNDNIEDALKELYEYYSSILAGPGVSDDTVKDYHIDWGTGTAQVSAVDIPIADAESEITATNVEEALTELMNAILTNASDLSAHEALEADTTTVHGINVVTTI